MRGVRRALSGVSIVALGVLSACGGSGPRQVSSAPPTVAYRVPGNDVSQANMTAAEYCRQYGMGARLQTVQRQGSESVAHYACAGTPVGSAAPGYTANPTYAVPVAPQASAAPAGSQVYVAPAEPVKCADFFHQDRPGGTDYYGPPVPGCPQQR